MHCTSYCAYLHLQQRWTGRRSWTSVSNCLSHGHFIGTLQCDPWSRTVAVSLQFSINVLLGMSGISSRVQPILALAHSTMPNGLFNIWYPRPFFYFTHKASWVCWPWFTLQPGMDWTRPFGRGETSPALRQRGIVSADPSHDGHLTKRRDVLGYCGALSLEEEKSVPPLCWLGLSNENETVREPSAIQCLLLSARPSCFLAADAGFSWPRASAHSELQQLWDYSGFIDLSKEPQTCWAGVKPGPQHPGSYKSGSSNHSANGFHTLSHCSMILLPNILQNVESDLTIEFVFF